MQAQNVAMNQELKRRHAQREKLKAERDGKLAQVIADWQAIEKDQAESTKPAIPAASSKPEKLATKEEAETPASEKDRQDEKPKTRKRKVDTDKQESGETKEDRVPAQYPKHGTQAILHGM